jgi:hypothetical protein
VSRTPLSGLWCAGHESPEPASALEHATLCESQHLPAVRAEVDQRSSLPNRKSLSLAVHLCDVLVAERADGHKVGAVNRSERSVGGSRHSVLLGPSLRPAGIFRQSYTALPSAVGLWRALSGVLHDSNMTAIGLTIGLAVFAVIFLLRRSD